MDLKLLLLFSILTISVYGGAGQDEDDGPLPDPPNELVDYIDGLSRQGKDGKDGGKGFFGKWWEKIKECAEKWKKGEKCGKSKDPENLHISDEDFNRFMDSDFDGFLAESRLEDRYYERQLSIFL